MRKGNNKKYFILYGSFFLAIAIIVLLIYLFTGRSNKFTFQEKSYINSNSNNVIDINFNGDLPIFSNEGEGVYYDYINDLQKMTELSFNIVVNGNANCSFTNKNQISGEDVVFYTDHYVLISNQNNKVNNLKEVKGKTIGVVNSDLDYVNAYLKDFDLELKGYESFNLIQKDMGLNINYAIVPMEKYINQIVYNNLSIVNHIEGLHSHYVLSVKDNEVLKSIFTKFLNKWDESLYESMNEHFLKLYTTISSLTELEKETVTNEDLIVGYIKNMPLEGKVNRKFLGETNEYLKLFSDMSGATYNYIEYDDINEALNALENKKVDIMMNFYGLNNQNYNQSISLQNIEYVILTHMNNYDVVDNLVSIKDSNVKMLGNTRLNKYIAEQGINVESFENYKKLNKSLDENDVLVVEKTTYDYYKNSAYKDFVIKYIGESNVGNNFLIKNDNKVLNSMFNFYLSTLGNKQVNNMATKINVEVANTNIVTQFILSNLIYIIALMACIVFFTFKLNKKVKVNKRIRKEDKLMYLDVMTNLKNRNYLNDNLEYWEANKIYPQTIIIVDLNDIAVINDTKGHEEGDKQIQAAAGILINTQRENSEIIRSNGNEFLIYLVGYDERQIATYVNKLMKEFKNLPYEYGASLGYSMIVSESTTIDDAMNEALIEMRKNKGDK